MSLVVAESDTLPLFEGEGDSLLPLTVRAIESKTAMVLLIKEHYLHRRAPCSFAFGLYRKNKLVGAITFGVPPSRHLQMGACPTNPDAVIELNRLWCSDSLERNTESWFIAQALKLMPPRIVVSYADTKRGHMGYVYRAANWNYAGYTDMERKQPRYDYITFGKHTRATFRTGLGAKAEKIRRKPKMKYWIVTGNRREKRELRKLCGWPIFSWHVVKPALAEAA